jgi:hypothetical protein
LRVWIGIHASWQVPDETIRRRGVALAAFAMALVNKRPVYLTPYWNIHDYGANSHGIVSFDLKTSPLVLSALLACLTRSEVTRYVGVPLSWIDKSDVPDSCPFASITRENLSQHMGPDDLFLPPLVAGDELCNDPIGWVKKQLEIYGGDNDGD